MRRRVAHFLVWKGGRCRKMRRELWARLCRSRSHDSVCEGGGARVAAVTEFAAAEEPEDKSGAGLERGWGEKPYVDGEVEGQSEFAQEE